MESNARGQRINRVMGFIEPDNVILDFLKVIGPVTTIILEGNDFVSSSSIKSKSVEKISIRITLRKPVYSRLDFLEFLLLVKDVTVVSNELPLRVIEENIGGVRRRTLDASQSSKNFHLLWKIFQKYFLF